MDKSLLLPVATPPPSRSNEKYTADAHSFPNPMLLSPHIVSSPEKSKSRVRKSQIQQNKCRGGGGDGKSPYQRSRLLIRLVMSLHSRTICTLSDPKSRLEVFTQKRQLSTTSFGCHFHTQKCLVTPKNS